MRSRLAAFTLVSLAAAVSTPSVLAQTVPSGSPDFLDPSQFSSAYTPDGMSLLEKFGWAGRVIIGHPDTKAIVPAYSYSQSEICDNGQYPDPSIDALLLRSGGIVVAGSLEDLCGQDETATETSPAAGWAAMIQSDPSNDPLVLVPGQMVHGGGQEYWLRCRESRPPAVGSACHETFSLSPYDFHQRLAADPES